LKVQEEHLRISALSEQDVAALYALLNVFAEAFDDHESYESKRPNHEYLENLLTRDDFTVLVAKHNDEVVGGLAAYTLHKFEQDRREMYIYDLAVSAHHRRKGVATALIEQLQTVARSLDAYVIFVQADREDDAAVNLYSSLGRRADVLHFDIEPAD